MNQPVLIKPPSILEEIVSQDSENYTNHSHARSAASRKNKKENTIRIGTSPQQPPLPKEHDNDSVHSNASAKSKGKKAKESTLARPKVMPASKV